MQDALSAIRRRGHFHSSNEAHLPFYLHERSGRPGRVGRGAVAQSESKLTRTLPTS